MTWGEQGMPTEAQAALEALEGRLTQIAEIAQAAMGGPFRDAALNSIRALADPDGEPKRQRIAELQAKKRTTKAEREELAQLTYAGPLPRVVPRSDEVPF